MEVGIFENLVPNIHYSLCAIIVLVIIIFSMFFRKMTKGSLNLAFILCVIVTLITTICDIISVFFYDLDDYSSEKYLFYLVHSSYYLFRNLNMPTYIVYIITSIGAWPIVKKQPGFIKAGLVLPYIGVLVLIILNNFYPILFHYDDELGFVRDNGRYYLYVEAAFYMILGMALIIRYSKVFDTSKTLSLISIFPLTVVALIIQFFDGNMLVEMFATTMVILLATITVHRPELLMHNELGAMTRYAYMDELKHVQYIKKPVTIMLISISNYNDIHAFVPYTQLIDMIRLLYEKGNKLKKELKYKGNVYYLEDGLFAIVSDKTPKEKCEAFAQRVYASLERIQNIDKLEVHIIPKVCYYDCPDDIYGYEELMSFTKSFESLLPAKKAPVDVSSITNTADFMLRNEIDSVITNAITHKRFSMYYQPIWSIKEQKFVSAEALIRLNDPRFGFVSPELFIAAAEKNGSIYQIGDFILDDVCRFIASEGFKKTGIRYIEINLAVAQCMQADLVDKIKKNVDKHKIDYSQMNLEITERESIIDYHTFDKNMGALYQLGASLSLDDYGIGYSNIRRIYDMPLKIVKIDKSFISLLENQNMHSILENTIRMLKDINKEVVVEGVEDEKALREFERMKCDYIQGFYFSHPLPEDEFVKFCCAKNNK